MTEFVVSTIVEPILRPIAFVVEIDLKGSWFLSKHSEVPTI